LADPSTLPCNCESSPFNDVDHGHVITGDLKIVQNNKLRKLLAKGPKFRENESINWKQSKESISKGLRDAIDSWTDLEGINKSAFVGWKNRILERVDSKIDSLKTRIHPKNTKKLLNCPDIIDTLTKLQEDFVMVPIDKADNNTAFVCKRYYVEVVARELGLLDGQSDISTYEYLNDVDINDIVSSHKKELEDGFNIKVSEEMHTLPDIYWLPKLHKSPIKAWFIIASKKCSVKTLSKDITSIFKLAYNQVDRYNQKASTFSGINTFWVVQNSQPIISAKSKVNSKKNAKTISSFDFSTLYTKIPHEKLYEELSQVLKFVFKGGNKKVISINKHGTARWTTSSKNAKANYDLDKTLKALKFVLDNCHFKFGNKMFRQIVGIPMGSDPAPYFANLFLYCYESRWLNRMKKENNVLARKFGKIFRYIDDLLAMNDGNEFEKHFMEIYPRELELKKENVANTETSFLELDISISENLFHTKLYDKRDSFGFHISRLPFKSSNIPNRMFYSSITAEILRICRASSNLVNAIESSNSLLCRMKAQGANISIVKRRLLKSLNKHQVTLNQYSIRTELFINELAS